MRKRIILFLAVLLLLATVEWRFVGVNETDPQLMIGVPIPALQQAVGECYEIGETDAVNGSPFQEVFDRVVHQRTEIKTCDGILTLEAIGEDNAAVPSYILYTYVPNHAFACDLSFTDEFVPYYDETELENGATVYRRSGRSVMPTTEFTYVNGEQPQLVYSVCDFIVYPGENAVSWAVCNPELTDGDARLISDYLQN